MFWLQYYQSDPLERHFNKYRQMSGGKLLESLREVNNLEKILKISSVIKKKISDEYISSNTSELVKEVENTFA